MTESMAMKEQIKTTRGWYGQKMTESIEEKGMEFGSDFGLVMPKLLFAIGSKHLEDLNHSPPWVRTVTFVLDLLNITHLFTHRPEFYYAIYVCQAKKHSNFSLDENRNDKKQCHGVVFQVVIEGIWKAYHHESSKASAEAIKINLGSCISVYNHAFAFPELVAIPATKRGNEG
ncbi:hypothetical protein LXL04_020136 [Taraxacum kok-saghyz]